MEKLWAPWRLEYLGNNKVDPKKKEHCPFCQAIKEQPSEQNLLLYSTEHSMVMMNKFPYNSYHLLVLPKDHHANPEDLNETEWQDLNTTLRKSYVILKNNLEKVGGFNMGLNLGKVGGGGLPGHLHYHIVPRWLGDTNFMPVLAEVKCLPEHMIQSYRKLKKLFDLNFNSDLNSTSTKGPL